jgi:hypothetical protein
MHTSERQRLPCTTKAQPSERNKPCAQERQTEEEGRGKKGKDLPFSLDSIRHSEIV